MVDATEIVAKVARAIERSKLDAVLIGNAGAAMHGAPVTTIDLGFLIRRTPANTKKLTAIAEDLSVTLYRPFFPVSSVTRMMNDDETLQVDFLDEVSGIHSFEGLKKRAETVEVAGATIRVAALADIIKMNLKRPRQTRKSRAELLRPQSEWLENDMIRRRVAAPLERRMNFLRKRIGICRSCL